MQIKHHGMHWIARGRPACPECNSNKFSYAIDVKFKGEDPATYTGACVCEACGCEYSYSREEEKDENKK